jgi:hypothetical protein
VRGKDTADGGSEEAAWRDLIANYDSPADLDGMIPWPDRENLRTGREGLEDLQGLEPGTGSSAAPQPLPGAPDAPAGPDTVTTAAAAKPPPAPARDPADEDHFVPPPPPPLPRLDPVTKGAWLALFGGPAYLLIAGLVGWTISGLQLFCAVGAFVAGFAILVMRMGDEPPRDSGPDDGAVV